MMDVPASPPISLHPTNPHYFLFRGKPTILITSAEHYGAVFNLDFDYVPYLNELATKDLNYTRICTGPYVEFPGWFDIHNNNQAPAPGRLICPWLRSTTPGYVGGGNKFDLTRWDPAFFARLKDFVAQASSRGIVVEISLFCTYYNDELWNYSPLRSNNNINGVGTVDNTHAHTMENGNLLPVQEAYVRKMVTELAPYDNVIHEICNEPYMFGVTLEWQAHIANIITQTEASLPGPHLITQNIANFSAVVEHPNPQVSVFNFHYCRPPDAVHQNYGLNKVIGLDETGTDGSADVTYRTQGWDFIIAGGGLYNNLDYSFSVTSPAGNSEVKAPGGGSAALRAQLRILKHFMEGFDFLHMAPDTSTLTGGIPDKATVRVSPPPARPTRST